MINLRRPVLDLTVLQIPGVVITVEKIQVVLEMTEVQELMEAQEKLETMGRIFI